MVSKDRILNVTKQALSLGLDVTVYLRFLVLLLCFRYLWPGCDEDRKISIANRFFYPRYEKAVFHDYKSYIERMPGDIRNIVADFPQNRWLGDRKVLDLGCGLGRFTKLLKEQGASAVVGLEYQIDKLVFAQEHNINENIRYICGSASLLPFKESTFDTVFAYAVFEHIDETQNALLEVARILKAGGVVVIAMDYLTSRGGHHLHPYVHFPWPLSIVSEESLYRYWSRRLARDQSKNMMSYYKRVNEANGSEVDKEICLNRITIEEFERQIEKAGMMIELFIPGERIAQYFPFILRFRNLRKFFVGSPLYCLRNNKLMDQQ
ncbi:MAG TPA: class I SAM-dependent methyltransferase [Syntrophorhabdaceae bacterium]|nr:class I SAM-dependent methyltransferase [Syntrophorhabdaceae bacterium]